MAPFKCEEISLYEEAKAGFISLFWQTIQVFIGLVVILLCTGGNPPGWLITVSFLLGIVFVAWRENERTQDGKGKQEKRNDREIRQIFDLLNAGKLVVVSGAMGSGKSSVLETIKQLATSKLVLTYQPIYINLKFVKNEKDFFKLICDYLRMENCVGYKFARALKKQNHRILLILDEADRLILEESFQRVANQLRSLSNGNDAPLILMIFITVSLEKLITDSRTTSYDHNIVIVRIPPHLAAINE